MRHLRPIIVAGAFALGASGIRAEEAANTGAEQPPQESIATAKQSFESLAKKHPADERGALDTPILAGPEFNLGTLRASEPTKAKAMAKPTKNWLVDGVMSKPRGNDRVPSAADTRRPDGPDARDVDGRAYPETAHLDTGSDIASSHERAGRPFRENPATASDSVNPLANYMSGWISTQDRALLLPQKSQDASATTWDNSFANLTSASSGAAAGGSVLDTTGLNQTAFKSIARENPYLDVGGFSANRSPESGTAVNFQNFSSAPPKMIDPVVRASNFESSAPAVAGTPAARDLAKPDDNAKYFKQLKRF